VGGVDTHLDNQVAAALDANGGVLGVESFVTTTIGFVALHDWMCGFGPIARVGIEGTDAFSITGKPRGIALPTRSKRRTTARRRRRLLRLPNCERIRGGR
jgi:transposase